MTDVRFDTLLAALARARTRRDMLVALATATMAGKALPTGVQAGDVTMSACRGRNEKCKRKSECCSERCRGRKGKKKRKCSCSPRGARCLETADCCESGGPLICVSGFCVPDR